MVSLLSVPLRSRPIAKRADTAPAFLIPDRHAGVQATTGKVRSGSRADQGGGQCATVVQIIERVCASYQRQPGSYPFLAWGDFQKHL